MGTLSSSPESEEYDGAGGSEVREQNASDFYQLPKELTSKYEVLDRIGHGSFGSVYKVREVKSKVIYAAKYAETKNNNVLEVSCFHII